MELARSRARAIERVASALMIQAEEDKRRTHHRVHSSQCVCCTCMMHACVKVKNEGRLYQRPWSTIIYAPLSKTMVKVTCYTSIARDLEV